jgi:hypothetical protein
MAKEPTRGDSQGYLKEFFLANPAVVLSLLYVYVTAIGMFYSAVLYGRFGINVFDYSEIGDFLLAAFKNPVAFLSGGLLAAVGGALLSYKAATVRRRVEEVEEAREARSRLQASIQEEEEREKEEEFHQHTKQRYLAFQRRLMVIYAIVIAVTSVFSSCVLPYYSAGKTASSIKAGETSSVDVRYRSFKGSAGQVTVPGLGFIGATEKAAFFYDVDDKRTIVIPQVQIVSIEVPE